VPILVLALLLGGCGGEADELDVVEGEAAKLGELEYSVEVTRFLNPADTTDAEYLEGQPPLEPDEAYLGAFLTVHSDDDERDLRSASDYILVDIRDNRYEPVDLASPLALDIGGIVRAGSQLPPPDSMAAQAPARGGALVFLVEPAINQRLPLSLKIAGEEETATIQLDI
jgi:hypothetical protein